MVVTSWKQPLIDKSIACGLIFELPIPCTFKITFEWIYKSLPLLRIRPVPPETHPNQPKSLAVTASSIRHSHYNFTANYD